MLARAEPWMVDIVSAGVRSRMMAGIKGKNSLPERLVRQILFASGYRFRIHRRDLPGTPDISMPGRKVAIFVHGCFWHAHQGCRYAKTPSTRPEFWAAKFGANISRDRRAYDQLASMGWRVLCVWECATRDARTLAYLQHELIRWLEGTDSYGEIGEPPRQRH